MVRWLDVNDTWLAAEWGHPSDNLGGILATADWLSRTAVANGKVPLTMHDVLDAMIRAHEIQGIMALENSFNKRSEEHTSELQSLMRISYAVFCLKKKKKKRHTNNKK